MIIAGWCRVLQTSCSAHGLQSCSLIKRFRHQDAYYFFVLSCLDSAMDVILASTLYTARAIRKLWVKCTFSMTLLPEVTMINLMLHSIILKLRSLRLAQWFLNWAALKIVTGREAFSEQWCILEVGINWLVQFEWVYKRQYSILQ